MSKGRAFSKHELHMNSIMHTARVSMITGQREPTKIRAYRRVGSFVGPVLAKCSHLLPSSFVLRLA